MEAFFSSSPPSSSYYPHSYSNLYDCNNSSFHRCLNAQAVTQKQNCVHRYWCFKRWKFLCGTGFKTSAAFIGEMLSKITKVIRVKVIKANGWLMMKLVIVMVMMMIDDDDDDLKLLTVTLSKDGWTKPQVSSSIFMAATSRPWLAHMQIQIQNSTRYRITRTRQNTYYGVMAVMAVRGMIKMMMLNSKPPRMPCHQFVTAVQCAHLSIHTFL